MSQIEAPTCILHRAARHETKACVRERCAFWEPGGAVVVGACLIERLGVDLRSGGLAAYLLDVRERLEQARNLNEVEAAHREFSRRIGHEM